jgi:serine/threonine protein kinase
MSPEQARGQGHLVDGRSDIFSLAVVFYELLTGRRPFRGDTMSDILEQITMLEARPPRQLDDTIPKELETICLKGLSKRQTERHTTAKDFAEDLKQFLKMAGENPLSASKVPALGPPADGGSGSEQKTLSATSTLKEKRVSVNAAVGKLGCSLSFVVAACLLFATGVGSVYLVQVDIPEPDLYSKASLPLLEETLVKLKEKLGPDHPDTLLSMNDLGGAYQKNGDFAKAELILRECLTICQKKQPDGWTTFATQSQLGGSLLGQKKYAEAEPLLRAGYEGMKQRETKIPANAKESLSEALEQARAALRCLGPTGTGERMAAEARTGERLQEGLDQGKRGRGKQVSPWTGMPWMPCAGVV